MPTYWGTNDEDSGRDAIPASGQQPLSTAVKRSAMWGAVVKVALLTLGLAASYYGSVATAVPKPTLQGLEATSASLSTEPPSLPLAARPAIAADLAPVASGALLRNHILQRIITMASTHVFVCSSSSKWPSAPRARCPVLAAFALRPRTRRPRRRRLLMTGFRASRLRSPSGHSPALWSGAAMAALPGRSQTTFKCSWPTHNASRRRSRCSRRRPACATFSGGRCCSPQARFRC